MLERGCRRVREGLGRAWLSTLQQPPVTFPRPLRNLGHQSETLQNTANGIFQRKDLWIYHPDGC